MSHTIMLEALLRQSREQGGTGMYLSHDFLEMLYEEVSKGLTRVWEANNARDDALFENRRLRKMLSDLGVEVVE